MDRKVAFLAIALLGFGRFILTGQQPATPTVFTTAQAEAGRPAFENSCAKCHTYLAFPGVSIPRVSALTGKNFVKKYGQWTAAKMFTLFRGAADTTPASELNMSDETLVNITAYILQRNGA
jgi:hypothetical protein